MKMNYSKTVLVKTTVLSVVATLAFALSGRSAETTLSDVHLCCQSCVKGVNAAVGKVDGATATVDKDAGTVKLSAAAGATVQKAVNALVKAGYYGKSSDSNFKLSENSGAKGKNVKTVKLEGVHLCCGKCVKAVDEAVKSVSGVKGHTAEKNAKSFEVNGDFNDQELVAALHKAGLTGRVAK